MTSQQSTLDPFLKTKNIGVEPEELLEPDVEPKTKTPTRFQAFKLRLSHYGNRVLDSAHHFVSAIGDAVVHIITAMAGSIILLPLIVLVRGTYVLLRTVFTSGKDIVLSLARALLDLLRLPFQAAAKLFSTFNKEILLPLLKKAKEDDTFAVIAMVMLIATFVAVYLLLRSMHLL